LFVFMASPENGFLEGDWGPLFRRLSSHKKTKAFTTKDT
jgi:hypothetical protein